MASDGWSFPPELAENIAALIPLLTETRDDLDRLIRMLRGLPRETTLAAARSDPVISSQ